MTGILGMGLTVDASHTSGGSAVGRGVESDEKPEAVVAYYRIFAAGFVHSGLFPCGGLLQCDGPLPRWRN